jgi:hypothetical protein
MKRPILFFLIFFIGNSVFAQIKKPDIDDFYIDYAVPDVSALGMLDIKNDEIVRPGNMKEFAAALSNFVDRDGSLKPALALEWSFMRTFNKNAKVKWDSPLQWRNLALSLATTEQDSLGLRLGAGFKFSPIDRSDPLGDPAFYRKIATLASAYYNRDDEQKREDFDFTIPSRLGLPPNPQMTPEQRNVLKIFIEVLDTQEEHLKELRKQIDKGEIDELDKFLNEALSKRLKEDNVDKLVRQNVRLDIVSSYVEIVLDTYSDNYLSFEDYIHETIVKQKAIYKKQHWNAFAFEVSAGWVGHSLTSSYDNIKGEKFSFFAGTSIPTVDNNDKKRKGQAIVQLKYNVNVAGDSIDYSGFSAGLRHLYGTSDNRLSVELLYSNSDTRLLETQENVPVSYLRYTLGAEFKIMDGSWIELAFGGQKFYEGENEKNKIISEFGFKHAIRSKPRYEK